MQTTNIKHKIPKHSIFLDYYNVVRRKKWIVFFSVVGVLVSVILFNEILTPIYEAETSIISTEPKDTRFALDATIKPLYKSSIMLNMIEQIKSRKLAVEVAQSLPEQIIRTIKLSKHRSANFTPEEYIARKLQENISAGSVPGADIIKIKVRANDPVAAKIIANVYVERLINWDLQKNREEISNIRDFVEKQLLVSQDKLDIAEQALQRFKEKNKIISLNDASTNILQRITETEVIYNQTKTELESLEERQRFIEQKKQELAPSYTTTSSTRAQQLKQRILELEMEYTSHQVKISAKDPSEMLALKQKINQTRQELVQELLKTAQTEHLVDPLSQVQDLLQESIVLEVNLQTLKARERQLKQIMADYEAELQRLPRQELELLRLIRERDVNNKIYSLLLEKREEARITEAGKIGNIHILDKAEEPDAPIKPQKVRNLILGFVLGLIFGVGLVFFLESLDTSFKSQMEVENYMELPVLASIPTIDSSSTFGFIKRKLHTMDPYSNKQFYLLNGNSYIREAYCALELNLSFIKTENELNSIIITSPGSGEGKTLTAVNIAQVFVHTGIKTLLIDCDLRFPLIHKLLNQNYTPGLTDVLTDKAALNQVIKSIEDNFGFLPCGTLLPNPSEILKTVKMKELITELKQQYELLILDTPPLIPVIDTIVLGNQVDGVCLVIKSGDTSNNAAIMAKQLLEKSNARIIGVILNCVDINDINGYRKYFNQHSVKRKTREKYRKEFEV